LLEERNNEAGGRKMESKKMNQNKRRAECRIEPHTFMLRWEPLSYAEKYVIDEDQHNERTLIAKQVCPEAVAKPSNVKENGN
jgi:hypothetical protein